MTFMPHLGQRLIAGLLLTLALCLMALPQGALAALPCGRASTPLEAKALAEKAAARDGAAWVEYNWHNPCTGKPMAKSTLVLQAGNF
jgi:hypothetical protein